MVSVMTRAQRKAQTREELMDAATRLFCSRGFHATSLDLVAAEAGYTKGAVYSNFSSKEDLFFAIYERRVEQTVPEVRRALESGTAPQELARSVISGRRGGRDDGWLAVFFEFWAHVLRNPPLRERFEALHRAGRQPFVEAAERLRLPVNAERWTLATTAMITGLSLEQLTDPSLEAGDLAAQMLEMLIRGTKA